MAGAVSSLLVSAAAAAGELSQAVPPPAVMTDSRGDYIVDEPFPQWVRESPPPGMAVAAGCANDPSLIPDWARPLPVEPATCAAKGAGGEIWIATPGGLIFLDSAIRGPYSLRE